MALKKGSVEPDGTILCWGSGIRCISTLTENEKVEPEFPVFLDAYGVDSARYDEDLSMLAQEVNRLMKETYGKRRNKALKLGLMVMDQGILPVWKREIDSDEDPAKYVDLGELVHLDGMTDAEIAQALDFEDY